MAEAGEGNTICQQFADVRKKKEKKGKEEEKRQPVVQERRREDFLSVWSVSRGTVEGHAARKGEGEDV